MLQDNLRDILKHTHELGFIKIAKVYGENGETKVESITENNAVILYGKLTNPIAELNDNTVGFSRMSILKGYTNFQPFMDKGSAIKIVTQSRSNDVVPAEISFKSSTGHHAHYRFMFKDAVDTVMKMPAFRGAQWDITYSPTQQNLTDLQYFSQILGGNEGSFSVVSENKELKLSIGSGPTDRSVIPFAEDVEGGISSSWNWPLSEVLSILKLSSTGTCTMYFSDAGALRISIDSGLGTYDYILPGRS